MQCTIGDRPLLHVYKVAIIASLSMCKRGLSPIVSFNVCRCKVFAFEVFICRKTYICNDMKPVNKWVVITLTIMTVMTDCCRDNDGSDPANTPSNPGTIKLTSTQKELVDSVNAFSFNLFNQIIESRKENESLYKQSIIVSPLSITYALSMLNNGAAGNTQAQIKQVLGFTDTGLDSINEFCKKMMESVPTLDPRTKVMIANNI